VQSLAWVKIRQALNARPLPPDESDTVFGEQLYTTPHHPRHRICIAAVQPLTIYFSVYYDVVKETNETLTLVTILRAIPMFE